MEAETEPTAAARGLPRAGRDADLDQQNGKRHQQNEHDVQRRQRQSGERSGQSGDQIGARAAGVGP